MTVSLVVVPSGSLLRGDDLIEINAIVDVVKQEETLLAMIATTKDRLRRDKAELDAVSCLIDLETIS
jgi:hypothetical protein